MKLLTRPTFMLPEFNLPSFFDEDWPVSFEPTNGLSLSEDEENIYVEASVPGLEAKDIEVTFDKGILWIRGEKKEEEKKRKFYRKASSSFSYRVSMPTELDDKSIPEAKCSNGVLFITLKKSKVTTPKRITVK